MHQPFPIDFLCVYSYSDTLAAKFGSQPVNKVWVFYCGRIHRNLIGPVLKQNINIFNRRDPATNREWNIYPRGNTQNQVSKGSSFFLSSRNIEENEFICSRSGIDLSELNRISRITKFDKIHSFNRSAIFYIETGNNSFCKHVLIFKILFMESPLFYQELDD